MFVDLVWPLNASSLLSASAELLVTARHYTTVFFYRATLCVSAVFAAIRCLCVHSSVWHVWVLYPDGWRYRRTSLSARYPHHSSFFWRRAPIPIPRETASSEAQSALAWENFAIFDWNRRLSRKRYNMARGCYGTFMGRRSRWRIDPCRFRRPWVTLKRNQIFRRISLMKLVPFGVKRPNSAGGGEEGRISRGQPRPYRKRAGLQRSPILEILSIYAHPLSQNYQISRGNMSGRGVCLGVSHTSHLKTAELKRSPILGVLLYLHVCLHPLTQNDQIQHCNQYGEGRVLGGQPRHCVCTNASRGLSATAEFLVQKWAQHYQTFSDDIHWRMLLLL